MLKNFTTFFSFTYWRVSSRPHDASDWGPERTWDWTDYLATVNRKGDYRQTPQIPQLVCEPYPSNQTTIGREM